LVKCGLGSEVLAHVRNSNTQCIIRIKTHYTKPQSSKNSSSFYSLQYLRGDTHFGLYCSIICFSPPISRRPKYDLAPPDSSCFPQIGARCPDTDAPMPKTTLVISFDRMNGPWCVSCRNLVSALRKTYRFHVYRKGGRFPRSSHYSSTTKNMTTCLLSSLILIYNYY
jgi:hypothetical protein